MSDENAKKHLCECGQPGVTYRMKEDKPFEVERWFCQGHIYQGIAETPALQRPSLEEKIQQAIERRREVTFSASENTRGFFTCLLYSRAKGGVSADGAHLEAALDRALAQLPEKADQ